MCSNSQRFFCARCGKEIVCPRSLETHRRLHVKLNTGDGHLLMLHNDCIADFVRNTRQVLLRDYSN